MAANKLGIPRVAEDMRRILAAHKEGHGILEKLEEFSFGVIDAIPNSYTVIY